MKRLFSVFVAIAFLTSPYVYTQNSSKESKYYYSELKVGKTEPIQARILFEGFYDLLKWKGDYYIRKDDESVVKLIEKKASVNPANGNLIKTQKPFIPILVSLFEDCEELAFGLLTTEILVRNRAEDFVDLLKQYHVCRNLPFTEIDAEVPWNQLSIGLRAEVGLDQFGVSISNIPNTQLLSKLARASFNWAPGGAIFFNIRASNPRLYRKTAYEASLGLRTVQANYSELTMIPAISNDPVKTLEMNHQHETISLKVGIVSMLSPSNNTLYWKLCLGINYPLSSNRRFDDVIVRRLVEDASGNPSLSTNNQDPFSSQVVLGPNLVGGLELGHRWSLSAASYSRSTFVLGLQLAWEGDTSQGVSAPFGRFLNISNRNVSLKLVTGIDF